MQINPNTRFFALPFALAIIIFAVLLNAPSTGLVMRSQLQSLVSSASSRWILEDMIGSAAPGQQSAPGDFPIIARNKDYDQELTRALSMFGSGAKNAEERQQRLARLAVEFPNHAIQANAHLLRYFTIGAIRVGRDAEVEKYMNPGATTSFISPPRTSKPEDIEAFEAAAKAGERLDPDNAYFPMMYAVGLFAQHKDEEGLAVTLAAAQKPRYEDYCYDEIAAKWRYARRLGPTNSIAHVALEASMLFPHYAQLRSAARLTTFLAVKKEAEGKIQQGYAIRLAQMQLGSKMRKQSRSLICNLVGVAITKIALNHVNGERYGGMRKVDWDALSSEVKSSIALDRYCSWAQSLGHQNGAVLAVAESNAGEAIRDIAKNLVSVSPFGDKNLKDLIKSWASSTILLTNSLVMLLFVAAAWILRGLKQYKPGFLITVTCLLFSLAVVLCIHSQWATELDSLRKAMLNLIGSSTDGPSAEAGPMKSVTSSAWFIRLSTLVLSLIVPAVTLLALGITQAFRRRPGEAESPFSLEMRRYGSVIALVMVIWYGVSVTGTAAGEAQMSTALTKMTQHEGRYYAERQHLKWPE